ncbi:Lrp/AsnC family transcriptional regulator [Halovivax limisalsi]|uniref:Lrp/AsnC family transcriptional regulator n=1 Tax=Halovivax limisalsi TaxID=1453760 RepID=UPI001FFCB243|nr:Lrp/AsnC family transcriptional regulator [Halovivax limisalsi]
MELDEVDQGILHALQRDARNNSAADISETVGVAPNTVRNRIERLEANGVIDGYYPHINYEHANYQLHVVFVCTVPVSDRAALADEALGLDGVVGVNERLSGLENLAVEIVAQDSEAITAAASDLESIGCTISDEWFLRNTRTRPFDHFGREE